MGLLNDLKIRNLKPGEKITKEQDGEGLYLEVNPNGSKTWRYRYWLTPTKDGIFTIGRYPAISLADARKKRDEARDLVRQGLNPTTVKQQKKLSNIQKSGKTFGDVAREWIADNPQWSDKYRAGVVRYVEGELLSKDYENLLIQDVTTAHLREIIEVIKKRGSLNVAANVRMWAGQIMRYAILHGLRTDDPAYVLRGQVKMPDHISHPYLQESELPAFLKALDAWEGFGFTKLAIKLQMLTFVRTQELRMAEWSEISLDKAEWRVAAHKMKKRQLHLVPLSRQAIEVIEKIKSIRTEESPYLFPNMRDPSRCMNRNSILEALRMIGYKGEASGHGFRSTASTILHENNWEEKIIEVQLAHMERDKTKKAYNHAQYLQQRREMMQWWADYLDQLPTEAKG